MKELTVRSIEKNYRVYIDNTIDKFHTLLEVNKIKVNDKVFLITDDVVFNIYKDVIELIKNETNCKVFYFIHGETNKSINTLQAIYNFLMENGATRNSTLIAFGGGIVGDLVGFAASTYMRGIKFINIPTTLLSQADSCIGGKMGYNYNGIKNAIGNFYNPVFVYVCIGFLKTLKNEQFRDGLGEAIKCGVIKDNQLLQFINNNYKYILEKENDKLLHIVKECLIIKSGVIEQDFKDIGIRNILNFGHTVGHGIEVTSNFGISHGEAVGLGMLVAVKLSESKLLLCEEVYVKLENLLKKLELPVKYKVDNYSSFMYAINHDKKNNGKIRFVLLEEIGKCKIKVEITEEEILAALKESIARG
jgi:3-dehydroquinate synthase